MTVAESIAIREKDEARCKNCCRFVCRICADCVHGSNFVPVVSVAEKIKDRSIDNYR